MSEKEKFINFWKVGGAFLSPCCITRLFMLPYIVANTVQLSCSGRTRICSNASERSIFVLKRALATSLRTVSWSGREVISASVLSLRCRASITVRIFPSFLKTTKRGADDGRVVGTHQPAFIYLSTFVLSSSLRGSGHLGALCIILRFGLINGIS